MSFIVVPLEEKGQFSYEDATPGEIAAHAYELKDGDSQEALEYLRNYQNMNNSDKKIADKFGLAITIIRDSSDNKKRHDKAKEKKDLKKDTHNKIANAVANHLDKVKSKKGLESPAMWKLINKLPKDSKERESIIDTIKEYMSGKKDFAKSDKQKQKDIKADSDLETHVKNPKSRISKDSEPAPKKASKQKASLAVEAGKEIKDTKLTDEEKKALLKHVDKIDSPALRKALKTKLEQSESAPFKEEGESSFNSILSKVKKLSGTEDDTEADTVDKEEDSDTKTWKQVKDETSTFDDGEKEKPEEKVSPAITDGGVVERKTVQPEEQDKSLFEFKNLDEALAYYEKNPYTFTKQVLMLIDAYNKFAKVKGLDLINTYEQLPTDIDDESLVDVDILNRFLTQI